MKINDICTSTTPVQKAIPPIPIGKSFEEALKDISAVHLQEKCKYILPCGWCEKRNMRCSQLPVVHNSNVAQDK